LQQRGEAFAYRYELGATGQTRVSCNYSFVAVSGTGLSPVSVGAVDPLISSRMLDASSELLTT
jgi:hypothetical protein